MSMGKGIDKGSERRAIALGLLAVAGESSRLEQKGYSPVFDETYLNGKIEMATPTWEGVDVDAYLKEIRGY